MRRWAVVLSAVTISLGAATTVAGTAVADSPDNNPYTLSNGHAGPMAGVVPARGDSNAAHGHGGGGGGGSSPNLTWHGGPVQTNGTVVYPVFWGTSWTSGSSMVSSMNSFYAGVGGTAYMGTNHEYTDGGGTAPNYVGTQASTAVIVSKPAVDYYNNGSAPRNSPSTGSVLNAIVAATNGNVVADAYYPVYADTPRGHAGFCAWHTYGSYNGVSFQFGFFWNLNGDPGCNPNDTTTGHSEAVAALGNVSGHELSEMTTDPQISGWLDGSGSENADKCAWTFGGTEQFSDGSTWLIQGNWSNNAYNNNQGYTDSVKGYQRGCINGN